MVILNIVLSIILGMILFIRIIKIVFLFGCWLVGFYGISTFAGYLTPNPFLRK